MRLLSLIPLPEPVSALFKTAFDFRSASYQALHTLAPDDTDILLCSTGAPRFDRPTIARLGNGVRALATYSVGHDHIDLTACEKAGIAVFNTPSVLADSVADVAMLLLLGAARRATESIDLIRSGAWTGWAPTQLNGMELRGKTLGILGMGNIGQRVAERARAFGMSILYSNRSRLPSDLERGARFVADAGGLAAESDILLLACPSTEATRRVVDLDLLKRARPSLILLNIGRGDLVDDDALIDALTSGTIAAAGLDVFNGEPRFDPRYLALPNMFMLPHIGSSTIEARVGMGRSLVGALQSWANGVDPPNRLV
jgi:glyoxylate reductase